MKRITFIIAITLIAISVQAQNEITDKERIRVLEEKVAKLEVIVNELRQLKSQNSEDSNKKLPVQISSHTPINSNEEIVPYELFEKIESGMSRDQVLKIMSEPYDIKKNQSGNTLREDWYYKKGGGNSRSVIQFKNGLVTRVWFPKKREDYPTN